MPLNISKRSKQLSPGNPLRAPVGCLPVGAPKVLMNPEIESFCEEGVALGVFRSVIEKMPRDLRQQAMK